MADATDVRDTSGGAAQAAEIEELPSALSISEAARRCGVHRNTVRRYLDDGRFPGAFREDELSPWQIPLQDLRQAGLHLRPLVGPEKRILAGSELAVRLEELQRQVQEMTRRAEVAEALLSERDLRIEDLRTALSLLARRRPGAETSSEDQAG